MFEIVDIIKELIETLINEAISLFDGFAVDQLKTIMNAESQWSAPVDFLAPAAVIYNYAIILITLKFLLKMFSIYVGWTDGELSNPLQMIVYFLRALVIAVSFEEIYSLMVRLTESMLNDLLNAVSVTDLDLAQIMAQLNIEKQGAFYLIAVLIFIILCFVLKFQFIKRGLEMYVVRVGFPLACVGLVDSNSGAFAPYLKIFIQNIITTLVQLVMFKISFVILSGGNLFWGIAAITMTLNTPKFLGQYMLQVFSSNGLGAYRGAANAVSATKTLVASFAKKGA